jgi:hypothetical protein
MAVETKVIFVLLYHTKQNVRWFVNSISYMGLILYGVYRHCHLLGVTLSFSYLFSVVRSLSEAVLVPEWLLLLEK